MGNCLQGSTSEDFDLLHEVQADTTHVGSVADVSIPPNPPAYEQVPPPHLYHPSPGVNRVASQLTEEEQVKIAQRIGLIQHLPTDTFVEGNKTNRECVICMIEFQEGDQIRFLPCLHTYHVDCIDDWLMRSFTCPSCMEPVDAALLTGYETDNFEPSSLQMSQTSPTWRSPVAPPADNNPSASLSTSTASP